MLTLSSTRKVIAMGVHCRIDIAAPQAPLLVDSAIQLLTDLENLWSRFRPTSDISRLNQANGLPLHVDSRTISLIAAMKQAHVDTRGSFNPCQLPTQISMGDIRSLRSPGNTVIPHNSGVFASLEEIQFHSTSSVSLPPHMTLDAGGIGKGFAADLIAQQAIEHGATYVCVNLGGDIRVNEASSTPHDTPIDIMHPLQQDTIISTISLRNGAVATSARNARQRDGRGIHNHIMGAQTDIVGASVIASSATWADVWTKHLILTANGLQDVDNVGLTGLIVWSDGRVEKSHHWKDFEQC